MMYAEELRHAAQTLLQEFDLPWVVATSMIKGLSNGQMHEVTIWKDALAWITSGEYADEDVADLIPNLRKQLLAAGAPLKPEPDLPF